MPIRQFADINQTSDAFGGGTNAGMNRHEEFRLERNREFHSAPKKTGAQILTEAGIEGNELRRAAWQKQKTYSTSISNTTVQFEKRSYKLPPVSVQRLDPVGDTGKVDYQLGGLGFHQHMYDLFAKTEKASGERNTEINLYNIKMAKKAQGGLFKKRVPPSQPLPTQDYFSLYDAFNQKLAAARIPVHVYFDDGLVYISHPSSERGNPEQELKVWSDRHWKGVAERPWNDFLIELPPAPPTK